jgi:hypothetical protein
MAVITAKTHWIQKVSREVYRLEPCVSRLLGRGGENGRNGAARPGFSFPHYP